MPHAPDWLAQTLGMAYVASVRDRFTTDDRSSSEQNVLSTSGQDESTSDQPLLDFMRAPAVRVAEPCTHSAGMVRVSDWLVRTPGGYNRSAKDVDRDRSTSDQDQRIARDTEEGAPPTAGQTAVSAARTASSVCATYIGPRPV